MDAHGNILKMSFLMSYLAMLICVASGIPFMTCVFRSVILMTLFALAGYAFRWFLLSVVSSVEPEEPARIRHSDAEYGEYDPAQDEEAIASMEQDAVAVEPENVEQVSEAE